MNRFFFLIIFFSYPIFSCFCQERIIRYTADSTTVSIIFNTPKEIFINGDKLNIDLKGIWPKKNELTFVVTVSGEVLLINPKDKIIIKAQIGGSKFSRKYKSQNFEIEKRFTSNSFNNNPKLVIYAYGKRKSKEEKVLIDTIDITNINHTKPN
jgi:hypothetical protein